MSRKNIDIDDNEIRIITSKSGNGNSTPPRRLYYAVACAAVVIAVFVLVLFMSSDDTAESEELELSDAQADRNDEIYEAAFEFCKVLTENPDLEWDMAFLGEIADLAAGIMTEQGHKVRLDCQPKIVQKLFSRV